MKFIPAAFVIQIPDYHQLGKSCGVAGCRLSILICSFRGESNIFIYVVFDTRGGFLKPLPVINVCSLKTKVFAKRFGKCFKRLVINNYDDFSDDMLCGGAFEKIACDRATISATKCEIVQLRKVDNVSLKELLVYFDFADIAKDMLYVERQVPCVLNAKWR